MYLTRVKGKVINCLDRSAKPKTIAIDPTEYRFKLALVRQNYDEVLHIIKTSNLVGQSIIAYLQKKGYPEIALHFVQDPNTRFDLAIECGNLDVALEVARTSGRDESWNRLANQALKQGNFKIVEACYQRTKNFDRLSFLYLATGHTEKLSKMLKISESRGDQMSRFNNALYLGNVATRVQTLKDVGMYPLAYATAKTNALEELAQAVLQEAGLSEEDVTDMGLPKKASTLRPPHPLPSAVDDNWPSVGIVESFFDRALTNAAEGSGDIASGSGQAYVNGNSGGQDEMDEWAGEGEGVMEEEERAVDEAAWDIGAEEPAAIAEVDDDDTTSAVQAPGTPAAPAEPTEVTPGISEAALWARNSPLAADHVAAGSFETAMSLLNRQVGVVNFAPLKTTFQQIYSASKLYVQANASLPPLAVYLRRNPAVTEPRSLLPISVKSLQSITSNELRAAYTAFTKAKFADCLDIFRSILHALLLTIASSPSEESEVSLCVVTHA